MNSNFHSNSSQAPTPGDRRAGWFRCWRNPDAMELWKKHRPAFFLLWLIAHRARYSEGFNAHGLERGQAFIGRMDAAYHGVSEQEYRTAKRILQDGGFATFKPTNQGTIATLTNTSIFDPFIEQDNEQANERVTSDQRAGNERVTSDQHLTRKKEGKERKEGKEGALSSMRPPSPVEDQDVYLEVGQNNCAAAAAPASSQPAILPLEMPTTPAPQPTPSPKQTDDEWLEALAKSEAYAGIDVRREHAKMVNWCLVNRRQPTRRRFINWLNRVERPMAVKPVSKQPQPQQPTKNEDGKGSVNQQAPKFFTVPSSW